MNFGEKLFKLRKEKGMSQENLADQIGTTRQAISKWENNQGFPEVEKLLQLSNVFEVSVDYLLKDDKTINCSNEKGYYVSKELTTGYISNEKKVSFLISLSFMFLAFTGIPYIIFSHDKSISHLGMAICVVLGIEFMVLGMFAENEQYKILKQEPLLFDYEYLKTLRKEYDLKKRKYILIAIISTVLFILGLVSLGLTVGRWSDYHSFVFLGFGIGLFGFAYSSNVMGAYELLVKNEQYSSSLLFKIKRKFRDKIDKF